MFQKDSFRKKIKKLIMTIDDKIKDEKQQNHIGREAAKISAFSSGKIDKYEYLTDEEILPSNERHIIKHTQKLVGALKSLNLPKKDEVKQINKLWLYFHKI